MFSLFSLTAFFHVNNFLYHDCLFAAFLSGNSLLRCCTASATDLRGVFLLIGDFYLTLLSHLPQYRECYGFERAFFAPKRFLPYTPPSRHLAQPAFIKASLRTGCSSLKTAGSPTEKYRPDPSFCLNHTVFSKSYYSVGSIYVLRPYRALYQPLPGFELTI